MSKQSQSNGYGQFNGKGWFTDRTNGSCNEYQKSVAQIIDPYFGFGGRDDAFIGLHMELSTSEYGHSIDWHMYKSQDIEEFFRQMKVKKVEGLRGRVIEIYRPEPLRVTGIGVNQHLLPQPRE